MFPHDVGREPHTVDLAHRSWTYSNDLSLEKLFRKFEKFTIYVLFTFRPLGLILFMFQPLEFYKDTIVLFHNYILAPVILHLGP
jgi:hypothetical protein